MIDRQMQQMGRLIDDLLDIARITQNKLELRRERIELASVLRAAVETSRPFMEARGQELVVDIPSEPIHLDGDPTRLAQVFANLLNNAAKYTDRGGRIWLHAKRQGSDAVVSSDTGVAFRRRCCPDFDCSGRSNRSGDSSSTASARVGARETLVEMHGAISRRRAAAAEGLRFSRPSARTLEPWRGVGPDSPGTAASASKLGYWSWTTTRISPAVGRPAAHLGNTTHRARRRRGTSRAGVQAARVLLTSPAAIEPATTARAIRREPWGEGMVLIALTGYGQREDIERSREAGFDQHLVKPVEPAAVIQVLASLEQTLLSRAEGVAAT